MTNTMNIDKQRAIGEAAVVGWLRSLDAEERQWTLAEAALVKWLALVIERSEYDAIEGTST